MKESGLQASASLVLAGVAAHGKTPINRVDHIDRGFTSTVRKSQAIATIHRISEAR